MALRERIGLRKKKEMRLRYDAQADAYDELYSDEQRTKYDLALSHLPLDSEYGILDCGCGTGLLLEKVAGNVRLAVGIDLSPRMLHRAKVRVGQRRNTDLVCADNDHLPFLASAFRHIFMFTVLPGRRHWRQPVKEAVRVVEADGTVTVAVSKRQTSKDSLLRNLRENGLEPVELVDHEAAPDYVAIGIKSRTSVPESPRLTRSDARGSTVRRYASTAGSLLKSVELLLLYGHSTEHSGFCTTR